MKKRGIALFLAAVIAAFISGCTQTTPGPGQVRKIETEKTAENNSSREENLEFLVQNYGFTEEELNNIDLERFIEDYGLHTHDYTPEEVRQILMDERDMYVDDGSAEVFSIFDKKSDGTKSTDSQNTEVVRIGYFYNEGTLYQKFVYNLQEDVWYLNTGEAHHLTKEQKDMLLSIPENYDIFNWKENYEGSEKKTTGSLKWKLVYELKDGKYRCFGGYTRDMSHLPENFREVDRILRKVAK